MNDSRGSIWRKWDLHIHTLASGVDYQDQSVTNDTIIEKLKEADISAVAITDHHLIDVDKILELQKLANNEMTIFPGIEFRSELGGSESVHFVGIFPETFSKKELHSLWTKLAGTLRLTSQDIEQRGHARVYCDFKDSADLIHELGGLVSVHAGRKANSIENIRNTAKFKEALKEDLAHDCIDILEVNTPDDVQSYKEVVFPDIGFELPIIWCSDNHNISQYSSDVPCWIKADPTFEGLKQILYEPQLRVRIQEENPLESETYAKIGKAVINLPKNLKIKAASGEKTAFCVNGKYEVDFSNNLTCIIGERGCGKSTIAHILYNSGTGETCEKLMKIESPLVDLELPPSALKRVAESIKRDVPSQSEFFFQNEIERAAKSIESMSKLVRHRLEKLSSIDGKRSLNELEGSWNKSTERINELISAYDEVARIDQSISMADKEKETLQRQTQVITSKEYKKFQTEIETLSRSMATFDSYKNDYEGLLEQIDVLKSAVEQISWKKEQGEEILKRLSASLDVYKGELKKQFEAVALEYNQEDFPIQLDKKKQDLRDYLKQRGLSPENVEEIADANQKMSSLDEQIRLLNLKKKPYTKIHEGKESIIQDYELNYRAYKNRFNEISSSLQSKLASLPISEKQITFHLHVDDIQLKANIASFVKANVKDQTVVRSDYIEQLLFDKADIDEFAKCEKNIRDHFNKITRGAKHRQILKELLNDEVFLQKLYLRLLKNRFDLDNIQVETKLGEQVLRNTSFGERCGIVVAIILVAGTNPIVIDQPEDHLGGKFISQVLVPLIRAQKHNRQIILITRDANVVIGGDAELIHILEVYDERTEIVPATIENIEYREKYIWILDGGKEAFMKRERKYNF